MDAGPGAGAAPARPSARPRAPAPPPLDLLGLPGEGPPRRRTCRTSVDLLSEASGAAALTLSFLSKDRPHVGLPPGSYNNSSVFSQACSQHQDVKEAEALSASSLQASKRSTRDLSQGNALSRKGTLTGRSSGGMLSKHLSSSQGSDTLPSPTRELRARESSSLLDRDAITLEHMRSQEHIASQLAQEEEQQAQQQEGNDSGSWSCSQDPLITASGSAATPSDLASSPCYSPLGSRNSGGPLRPTLNSGGLGSTGDRSSGLTSRLSNSSKPGPGSESLLGSAANPTLSNSCKPGPGSESLLGSAANPILSNSSKLGPGSEPVLVSTACPILSNPPQPNPQHAVQQTSDRGSISAVGRLSHSGRQCPGPDQAAHMQRQAAHCAPHPGLVRKPTQDEPSTHQQAQLQPQLQQAEQLPPVLPQVGAPSARPSPAPSSDALTSSLFGPLPSFSIEQLRGVGGPAWKPSPQKATLGSCNPNQPTTNQSPEDSGKPQGKRAGSDAQLPSIFAAPSSQFSRSSIASENERPGPSGAVKHLNSAPDRSLTRGSQERLVPLAPPNSSSTGANVQQRAHQQGQASPSGHTSGAPLNQEHLMAERQGMQGRKSSCEQQAASSRSARASQEAVMQQRWERGGLSESPARSVSPPASPARQHTQQRQPPQQRPVSPQMNCGRESSLLDGVATLFRMGKKKHDNDAEEPTPEPSIGNIFSGLLSRLRLPTHATSPSRLSSRAASRSPSCSPDRNRVSSSWLSSTSGAAAGAAAGEDGSWLSTTIGGGGGGGAAGGAAGVAAGGATRVDSSYLSAAGDDGAAGGVTSEDSSDLQLQQEHSGRTRWSHDQQLRCSGISLQQEPSWQAREAQQQDRQQVQHHHHQQQQQQQQQQQRPLQQRASAPTNSLKSLSSSQPLRPKNVLVESANLLSGEGSKMVRRTASTTLAAHSSEGGAHEQQGSVMSGRTMRRSLAVEGEAAARHKSFMYKRSLSNHADPMQPARGKSFVDLAMPERLRGLALQQLEQRKVKPGR